MPQELTVLNQNLSVLSLEQATDAAHTFVRASRAASTLRSYQIDAADFTAWCSSHDLVALPVVDSVAAYLAHLARAGMKAPSITRRFAGIRYMHRMAAHEPPTSGEAIKAGGPMSKEEFDAALVELNEIVQKHSGDDPLKRSIAEASRVAGRSLRTLREWCMRLDLGRRIGGQWAVSKVARAMWLDGNTEALGGYLAGDRVSPLITDYFQRCGVPLPRLVREP